MNREERRRVLESFSEDLMREAHILAASPDLLWQQLYNRLQWVDGPENDGPVTRVLSRVLTERSRPEAPQWLRSVIPVHESAALIRTMTGHTDAVHAVAFSPDGTRIASGSDTALKVWDAARSMELNALTGHIDMVLSVAFSPDSARIAIGSTDGIIRIWDAARGRELATLTGHKDRVLSVAYSPDGARIVSGSSDGTVRLWDAARRRIVRTLTGHADRVLCVTFSPDGARIASGSKDGTVKIWDSARGRELATLTGHGGRLFALETSPGGPHIENRSKVLAVAYSPDGARIASASEDMSVKVWNAATGVVLATLVGHGQPVSSVAFSPDGSRIVSGSGDNTLKLWDAVAGRELATLRSHSWWVNGVAFSPDGAHIVSGSADTTLKIWDAAAGAEVVSPARHLSPVRSVGFSPDGSRIVSGSWDGMIKLWDTRDGAEVATMVDLSWVDSVAFSPDGSRIVSGSRARRVKIWDAARGTELAVLTGHADMVFAVAFSPDGSRIVSGSKDRTIRIWDAVRRKEVATLTGHTGSVFAVAYSPDGARIASGAADSTVRIWDAARRRELATFTGHTDAVLAVDFSPDGGRIASASADGTVKLWDTAGRAAIATLVGHSSTVDGVAFSPDGARLVSASSDRTLRLWDAASGAAIVTLPVPGAVNCCAFNLGGTHICCGDESGTVYLLELRGGAARPFEAPSHLPEPVAAEPERPANEVLPTAQVGSSSRRSRIAAAASVEAPARHSVASMVVASGLRYYEKAPGRFEIPFEGRTGPVVVNAAIVSNEVAILYVPLPRPGLFGGGDAPLRRLLDVAFKADYVKAFVTGTGELVLAVEQPVALLTPDRLRGFARGLAALCDVRGRELGDSGGWAERLAVCDHMQGDIAFDGVKAAAAVRAQADRRGLPVREIGRGACWISLRLPGIAQPLEVGARPAEHVLSVIAYLRGTKPRGNQGAYMRRLLELSRDADVARIGLDGDGDGDVSLIYEVPEVDPGLFDRVSSQFAFLIAGLVALEQGN